MPAKLNTFALVGIDAAPVEAEVDVSAGPPPTVLLRTIGPARRMRGRFLILLLWIVCLQLGCDVGPAPTRRSEQQNSKGGQKKMDGVSQTISLSGFDPAGEPEIRVMSDGSLMVVFNFMPPSFVSDEERREEEGLGPFKGFDKEMQTAIGTQVLWEDREFFRIPKPKSDTIERIRRFLKECRNR